MADAGSHDLQARAREQGLEAFSDAEVLGLFLVRAGPPRATLAAALLKRFGDLPGVLGAPVADLTRLLSADLVIELKLLHEATVRVTLAPLLQREILSSSSAVADYLKILLAAQPREQVWALFLDKRNRLLASEKLGEGTVDHAPVYPREVVRRALELNSSALILVHNHPSGDPTPSGADIAMTREVIAAAQALRIAVHDHVVVGRGEIASLKHLGLI